MPYNRVPRVHALAKSSAPYLIPASVVDIPPLSAERFGSQKNTATERGNLALFCRIAAAVNSGKWESLFLVILDILYRESICAMSLQRWIPAHYLRG